MECVNDLVWYRMRHVFNRYLSHIEIGTLK